MVALLPCYIYRPPKMIFFFIGTVVSGTNLKGTIKLNDTLLLGPDPLGHFTPIAIKSIHR